MSGFQQNYIIYGPRTKAIIRMLERCSDNFSPAYGCDKCPDLRECKKFFDLRCTSNNDISERTYNECLEFFYDLKHTRKCVSPYPCEYKIRNKRCSLRDDEKDKCPNLRFQTVKDLRKLYARKTRV